MINLGNQEWKYFLFYCDESRRVSQYFPFSYSSLKVKKITSRWKKILTFFFKILNHKIVNHFNVVYIRDLEMCRQNLLQISDILFPAWKYSYERKREKQKCQELLLWSKKVQTYQIEIYLLLILSYDFRQKWTRNKSVN